MSQASGAQAFLRKLCVSRRKDVQRVADEGGGGEWDAEGRDRAVGVHGNAATRNEGTGSSTSQRKGGPEGAIKSTRDSPKANAYQDPLNGRRTSSTSRQTATSGFPTETVTEGARGRDRGEGRWGGGGGGSRLDPGPPEPHLPSGMGLPEPAAAAGQEPRREQEVDEPGRPKGSRWTGLRVRRR